MTDHHLLCPSWREYELIDSGGGEKLERFGPYSLIRPEPQAVYRASLPRKDWEARAHAHYVRDKARATGSFVGDKGQWNRLQEMPDVWTIGYRSEALDLRLRLALTGFGHVGLFPEQACNWEYIAAQVKALKRNVARPDVLNLFAYTGGASLAAAQAGAFVTHVDSVRQTITWTNQNREASKLPEMRWMVDDAMKFCRREARKGARYHGIILDPPAYGRGPDGEKWVLEDSIDEMMGVCHQLLHPHGFVVLNLYSMGMSALVGESLVHSHFGKVRSELGGLYLPSATGQRLPLGTFVRFCR
jgi:23S rRNA (cytosine1962-C5)-methyltransferase